MHLAVSESVHLLSSRENYEPFSSCTTSEKTITINFPSNRFISNFAPNNTRKGQPGQAAVNHGKVDEALHSETSLLS